MVNEAVISSLPSATRNDSIYAYLVDNLGNNVYTFLFNPESKSFNVRANYAEGAAALTSLPSQSYQYTSGLTLQLSNLILESWARSKSIKPLLDSLLSLTKADPAKGKYSPSPVTFVWGSSRFGLAVITSLDWTETAWIGGEPASARVNMTLLEVPPVSKQENPQTKLTTKATTPQPLTDRQKAEAISKARDYIKTNLRSVKSDVALLYRSGRYSLSVDSSGVVSFLDSKKKLLGVVGTYKNGKFSATGRTV